MKTNYQKIIFSILFYLVSLFNLVATNRQVPNSKIFCEFTKSEWRIKQVEVQAPEVENITDEQIRTLYRSIIADSVCFDIASISAAYKNLLTAEHTDSVVRLFFNYQRYKEIFSFDTGKVQNAFQKGVLQLLIPFNVIITLQNSSDEATTSVHTLIFDSFYGETIISVCKEGAMFSTKRRQEQSVAQMILTDGTRE